MKIEVMVYEPNKSAGELRTIDDSLEAMQSVVGGYIEQAAWLLDNGDSGDSIGPGLVVLCNEDGRSLGLASNRCGFLGTFFVVRQEGAEYVSLTDNDKAQVTRVLGA